MTCIVGMVHNGDIYIGGDSAGVDTRTHQLRLRQDRKVFEIGREFLIGFTTSFRMGQLLRYSFMPPERKEEQDAFDYMASDFVDAVRDVLKEGGAAKIDKEVEEGGQFLVGYDRRLFLIGSDFQVGESIDQMDAVGSGGDIALGALRAMKERDAGFEPPAAILRAISIAARYNVTVREPTYVTAIHAQSNEASQCESAEPADPAECPG